MSIAALLLFVRTLGLTLPLWIVAGWSAAEAALFFIVADVPISWIAVRSGTRAAVLAAIVAAVASAVGAAVLMLWAHCVAALPAIDFALMADGARGYHEGPLAMLVGSFSGTPFKLYVLEAAKGPQYTLLLLAPLLRLPRFLLVALFVGGISQLLCRWFDVRKRLAVLGLCWVAFYAFYFSAMPR